jgi:Rrf2 family cysteine metabolism transcriptional repressor
MILSTKCRYGLRAVIDLAMLHGKEPVPLKVISKDRDISAKYLEQILNRLKSEGTIKTFRGPFGGYALAMHPREITLGKIISVLEGPDDPIECDRHEKFSTGCYQCVTKAVFTEVKKRTSAVMDSITLQDLLELADGKKKDF